MDYRERCSVMEACLPKAIFREQTEKLHSEMLTEIESLRAKLEEAEKDAELYRFLRENDVFVRPCMIEKRGYRTTLPNAPFVTWQEQEGWLCSTFPITHEPPFKTMDEAIDAAIDAAIAKQKEE